MKKLNVLFGLMLMAGFSFAQTTTITQTNIPGASSVEATVTQTGANAAVVTQENIDGVNGPNTVSAKMVQVGVGAGNTATVNQKVSDEADNGILLTTDSYQEGEGNQVVQTQIADGHRDDFVSREFVAKQDGNNNTASQISTDSDQGTVNFLIDQKGDNNQANQLTQNEGGWAVGEITQDGLSNKASQTFESINADGFIEQKGEANEANQQFDNNTKENHADILQDGYANKASQTFTGNDTHVSTLNATQQGSENNSTQTVSDGNNNYGDVLQTGNSGSSIQLFYGSNNLGYVDQDGIWNNAAQTMSGNSNLGEISQTGSSNSATQTMNGTADHGVILQSGALNAVATQTFSATASGNMAKIEQLSVYNNATATQYIEGANNTANIKQTGGSYFNYAEQNILGAESSNNTLTITQDYGDKNNGKQTVTGSNNAMYIEQHGIWWGLGENAKQTITGDENAAEIVQIGNNDYAEQNITGDGNTAKIYQGGNDASATIDVFGNENVAAVSQAGDGSVANIYQEGDLNVVQGIGGTGTFAVNSNGSVLTVDQLGNSNTANVSQTAFGANADINQNGVGNVATVIQH